MDDVAFVDASPLIHLGQVGRLELLRLAAARVVVPEVAAREIAAHGADDVAVRAVRAASWIETAATIAPPADIAAWDLGAGETQVLALVRATPRAVGIVDDRAARRCARILGIPVHGTVGVILLARRQGRLAAARPVVEELRRLGMRLAIEVMNSALREVGE